MKCLLCGTSGQDSLKFYAAAERPADADPAGAAGAAVLPLTHLLV